MDKKELLKIKRKLYRLNNLSLLKERELNYRLLNKDKIKEYSSKNKERISLNSAKHRKNNPEKVKMYSRKDRLKHKGRCNSQKAKRRASKLHATPPWLTEFDFDYIKHLYIQAKELEKLDGIKYHVDHIVPLINDNVCGLHVPWNLQVITAEENMSKGNKLN